MSSSALAVPILNNSKGFFFGYKNLDCWLFLGEAATKTPVEADKIAPFFLGREHSSVNVKRASADAKVEKADKLAPFFLGREHASNVNGYTAPSPRDDMAAKGDTTASFPSGVEHTESSSTEHNEEGKLAPFFLGAKHTSSDARRSWVQGVRTVRVSWFREQRNLSMELYGSVEMLWTKRSMLINDFGANLARTGSVTVLSFHTILDIIDRPRFGIEEYRSAI